MTDPFDYEPEDDLVDAEPDEELDWDEIEDFWK
jgi:hypothetical protein